MNQYDVIVIGAGVTGCAVARYLSRYRARILVLEKEEDVCSGTSKANSGIVHAGFDAETGSMMARMNVKGAAMIRELSHTLDFPYRNNGSLVLCFDEADLPKLRELYERGIANGVEGLKILTGEVIRAREPSVSAEAIAALWAPSAGIVCPFSLTIALAENAADNGVEFRFLEEVREIRKIGNGFSVKTGKSIYEANCLVNAAGVYADTVHNLICETPLSLTPRRGEYFLLDKEVRDLVSSTIFQLPGKYGKGVLVTPTAHGNLLVGPNAIDINDKEDTETTREGLDDIRKRAQLSVPGIPFNKTITSFSGLRAHGETGDFIIGESSEGFFDCAGIESPGLTSAPAIGEYLADLIAEKYRLAEKPDFRETRKGFIRPEALPEAERTELIRAKPAYGNIVCRCEHISEGEIVDAIHRNPGARSMDGIKRRVRQGMGRCQAGFCTPKAMQILARELNVPMTSITKNRPGSELLRTE